MKARNKKGSLADIIVWIVALMLVVIFFGSWIYMHNIMTTAFQGIPDNPGGPNITAAVEATIVQANNALTPGLQLLAFIIIFGMVINILISNFLIKAHPAFFILYLFMAILGIMFSVVVSNIYEDMLAQDPLGTTLQTFTATNVVLLNLPLWTALVTIFGAILLFIGTPSDLDVGGGV